MTRFRLLAGSIAKNSFPTICSYGPVEPNDRPPATSRRAVISTRDTSARTCAGRSTTATKRARAACRRFIVRLLNRVKLCSCAIPKSTFGSEVRIDQVRVTFAESANRIERQASVRVRAAEAPRPRTGVAACQRLLQTIVKRRRGAEFTEDEFAADIEGAHRRHEWIDIPGIERIRICVQLEDVESQRVIVPGPQI